MSQPQTNTVGPDEPPRDNQMRVLRSDPVDVLAKRHHTSPLNKHLLSKDYTESKRKLHRTNDSEFTRAQSLLGKHRQSYSLPVRGRPPMKMIGMRCLLTQAGESYVVALGVGVVVALILTVGTVYGMTRWNTPQQGVHSGGLGGNNSRPAGSSYPC